MAAAIQIIYSFGKYASIGRKVKQFYILALWLFISSSSIPIFAQIDSLEQVLTTLPDNTQKVDVLNELSYAYHNNDIQQTFSYANEALALTEQLSYIKGKAYALHNLCIANSVSGNGLLAIEFNDKVIHLSDSLEAYQLLIDAYKAKGIIQDKAANPEVAIQYFQKSFDLALTQNYPPGLISACFSLGNAYAELGNFDKATTYYKKAVDTAIATNDKSSIAWGTRSIASIHYDKKDYSTAALYFEKALKMAREANSKRSLSFTLSESANNHFKMGKKELAEQYLLEAIQLIQAAGDNEGTLMALHDLAKFYIDTDRPNKAIKTSNEALVMNKQASITPLELGLLNLLSEAHAKKQAFQKAYEIQQLVKSKQDSLDYNNKLGLTAELEEKYQSKKRAAENVLLKAEQQHQKAIITQQKSLNFFLIIIACLLGLLVYSAFSAYSTKKRNNLLLEEKVTERTQELQRTNTQLLQSNEELERFAYVASHDLREPLGNITNFTQLLQKKLQPSQEKEALQFLDIIHKNAAHLNKMIIDTLEFTKLTNLDHKIGSVDLNQTIKNIESSITTTLTNKRAFIEISKPLPIIKVNEHLLISVFKSLIENGITYNENTIPSIKIDHIINNQTYVFSVKDNGIGIPEVHHQTIFKMFKRLQNREQYEGSGMGLANCKKIINKLGGKIWVRSDGKNGATFFFTIPILQTSNAQTSTLLLEKIAT